MIKKDLKCPKCGKTLLRGYSGAVYSVTCRCGGEVILKDNGKPDIYTQTVDKYLARKRGSKHNAE